MKSVTNLQIPRLYVIIIASIFSSGGYNILFLMLTLFHMCKLNTHLWKHIYIFHTYTLSTHTRCNCIIIMGLLLGQQLISFYIQLQMYKYTNTLLTTKIHGSYWAKFEDNNTIVIRLLLFYHSICSTNICRYGVVVFTGSTFLIIRRLLMSTVEQTTLLLHSNQWCRLLCSAQPWNKKYSLYLYTHVTLNYTNIN